MNKIHTGLELKSIKSDLVSLPENELDTVSKKVSTYINKYKLNY